MSESERRTRRHDPERRERIIAACLDVIAENGVAGTSHRKVAQAADVSLGSMTYHFAGMDDLLHEAFTAFSGTVSDRFQRRMDEANDVDAARQAVAAIILEDVFADSRELALTHELYNLAIRDPRYRQITDRWMARSREALERHFDPRTARLLDALIEGLTLHRALHTETSDSLDAEEAVNRLTASSTSIPLR